MRRGADLESLVEAGGLARGAEQRQQRVGDREQEQEQEQEQESVAAVGAADMLRAETAAETDILGVAEGLFERLYLFRRERWGKLLLSN